MKKISYYTEPLAGELIFICGCSWGRKKIYTWEVNESVRKGKNIHRLCRSQTTEKKEKKKNINRLLRAINFLFTFHILFVVKYTGSGGRWRRVENIECAFEKETFFFFLPSRLLMP